MRRLFPRQGGQARGARKGAELGRVSRTMTAYGVGPIARLGINPIEGVLGRVYSGLKQAAMLRVLARRWSRGLHRKVRRVGSAKAGVWSSCVSAVV
jgi:hypothetical protein